MKRTTINKLLAVALGAAICIPALLTDPMTSVLAVSGNQAGSDVSGNVAPSTSGTSGGGSSSSSNSGSSTTTTTAISTGNVTVAGARVVSTVGGVNIANAIDGAAITTPVENLAAAIGLSEADVKAGTNVRTYICNTTNKATKEALQNAAQAAGKSVAGYVNFDLYTITKKGVVTKVTTASEPVTITLGLPARYVSANRNFAVVAIDAEGNTVVMEDTDTNPRTLTINTKVFGAFSIVY